MQPTETELLILSIGALGLGMYLLYKGGDWTIDAAVAIAQRLGVSPLVIGFTIVAFGTSLPELIVSLNAHLAGSSGIAIGNVIGSNIANILLVIGVTAFFATLTAAPKDILRDMIMMLLTSLLMVYLILQGTITQFAGGAMVAFLLSYVVWQYVMAAKGKIDVDDIVDEIDDVKYKSLFQSFFFLFLGMIAIAGGAEFLVRGAKVSAVIIGVPEDVIGLSVIALGTSLPELSTCIIAAMKKQSDLIIGNILGSNVFNILMILGITSSVKAIPGDAIAPQILSLDIWVMLGVAVIFSAILLLFRKINKYTGFVFVGGYVFYIGLIYALYLQDKIPNVVSSYG
ncbi:MAG: calcium/sodium antiporter [Pseudomonadota bacterium]